MICIIFGMKNDENKLSVCRHCGRRIVWRRSEWWHENNTVICSDWEGITSLAEPTEVSFGTVMVFKEKAL